MSIVVRLQRDRQVEWTHYSLAPASVRASTSPAGSGLNIDGRPSALNPQSTLSDEELHYLIQFYRNLQVFFQGTVEAGPLLSYG